jgi:ABC-type Fe3+-hydroxamate transport system substrate-binding protein
MIIYGKDIKPTDIKPNRIISLVPSITETLFYLGLEDNIVGITKWCKYPEQKVKTKRKIGGVVGINIAKIKKLKPDLIFATKEENDKDEILELSKFTNVFVSKIRNINDAYKQILNIGVLTMKIEESSKLVEKIKNNFLNIANFNNLTYTYLVWNKPLMLIGGNTFISNVLEKCNLKNVFSNRVSYPEISINEIKEKNPDIIFLCSEPFKFVENHKNKFQKDFPESKILLVDGEIFSWYGSHLLKTKDYCNEIKKML